MISTIGALTKHLQAQTACPPIVALFSTCDLLKKTALDLLQQHCVEISGAALQIENFTCKNGNLTSIIQSARTLPMFAKHQWIHLTHSEELNTKTIAPLMKYIEEPSPYTTLCLSGQKIDRRQQLGKLLLTLSTTVQLTPPPRKRLPDWLQTYARQHQIKLQPQAAHLLVDLCDAELGPLCHTLEALHLYTQGSHPITTDDVEACYSSTRLHSIFDLTRAVGQRKLTEATQLLHNALDGGQHGLMIFTMLTRHLRHLLHMKRQAHNTPITSHPGVPPFAIPALKEQAKLFTLSQLCRAIKLAAKTDLQLRQNRTKHALLLQEFITNFTTQPT